MRLRYRASGDKVLLSLEDDVDDEPRVWRLLQTMGCPTLSMQVPGQLMSQRYVPLDHLPKLERTARMLRWELVPEAGEAVVAAPTSSRKEYEAARPLDPVTLLASARAEAAQGEALLRDGIAKLAAWAQAHPGFAREAQQDIAALQAALAKAQAEVQARAVQERAAETRSLAE
ncbi:MAG: hypothetical protein LC624_09455, partial [Halobacteriales archaeon]|nr:hypothetical protein [Halobacteriales archaeon]